MIPIKVAMVDAQWLRCASGCIDVTYKLRQLPNLVLPFYTVWLLCVAQTSSTHKLRRRYDEVSARTDSFFYQATKLSLARKKSLRNASLLNLVNAQTTLVITLGDNAFLRTCVHGLCDISMCFCRLFCNSHILIIH